MTVWDQANCSKEELSNTLNDLTLKGYHVWPQCIYYIPKEDRFCILVSKEISKETNKSVFTPTTLLQPI